MEIANLSDSETGRKTYEKDGGYFAKKQVVKITIPKLKDDHPKGNLDKTITEDQSFH